ncbi:MAG: hypothetical protein IKJ73_08505 [Lachnospiraceae bacterium]|nr:hypothetical protein [Lachnospiraceae bacterium]
MNYLITIKYILFYIIASGIGTFVCKILETTPMNVWLARGTGAAVAVFVGIGIYKLWIRRDTGAVK